VDFSPFVGPAAISKSDSMVAITEGGSSATKVDPKNRKLRERVESEPHMSYNSLPSNAMGGDALLHQENRSLNERDTAAHEQYLDAAVPTLGAEGQSDSVTSTDSGEKDGDANPYEDEKANP